MGLRGLQFQTLEIPFVAGLKTKDDPRAMQPPGLSIARDVTFDSIGALQTRYPYASIGANILGGGTLSNVRRIYANDTELICLTSDTLYSWDAGGSVWVSKGTHLAVAMHEQPAFVTTDDQVDGDRAELNGVVVYAWTGGGNIYIGVKDKTTGAVLATKAQTIVGSRARLVALSTKIVLFYVALGNLNMLAIDPANLTTSLAAPSTMLLAAASFNTYYDVTRVIGADQAVLACRRQTTTAYSVFTITAALATATATPGRTCDGVIALSCTPDGAHVQIVRSNAGNLEGDLLTLPGLADVYTAQAIGTYTNLSYVAVAHRSVQNSSHYRAYVFWTDTTSPLTMKYNWVDDGNNLGTSAAGPRFVNIASRAFDYNGSVYFWVVFAQPNQAAFAGYGAQLQNTYFLLRDDMFLAAKAAYLNAAGPPASTGHLPTVQSTAAGMYSWCGGSRRIIPLGTNSSGFAQRALRDISFTFDSNDARRAVRLGRTFYIACGEGLLAYDGAQLVEAGFHVMPWSFLATALGAGMGLVGAGTYAIKCTYRWDSAAGEIDRSTTTNVGTVTCAALDKIEFLGIQTLTLTHKTANEAAVEVWRTAANPTIDAPFYLVTSKDPSITANPNRYLPNDHTANSTATFDDNEADAIATANESNPENGAILQNLAPPAASIIAATADRIFLGGVAGDPHRIRYSKQRTEGSVASFNDGLTVAIPPAGGDITGIAIIDESPIVYRQRALYRLEGSGYDNAGGGANYTARLIASDVGAVSPESIAVTPFGHVFKSSKGWYKLGPDLSVQYIGKDVAKFDSDTVYSCHVVESRHEIRVITNARCLVFNYEVGEWAEWTISDGLHACLWQGSYLYAATASVKQEQSTYSGVDYGMDVELAFFKPPGLQGRMTVLWFQLLAEWRSAHRVQFRIARDYASDGAGGWTYFETKVMAAVSAVAGGPVQLRHGPSQKRCEAIKVRITALATDGVSAPSGEALRLTGIAFRFGVEDGLYPQLPAAQTT
jgi:hypothetical protein